MVHRINHEFVEENFPTLSTMTYLNNASTGIPPVAMVDAVGEYLDNRVNKRGDFSETLTLLKDVRGLLAEMLGGDYSQYALVPSTSAGVNSFAHAIDYPSGSNIVICDLEFPANYIPWQNVCNLYGVELRVVKSENGEASPGMFMEHIDAKTRVVAVSYVQFGSGYRTHLKELANAVHDVNGFLFSDIIQAAGWANVNLVDEAVDFAAGQAAKWLLGPIGAGYVYVRESILDQLKPKFLGWWGVKNLLDFSYSDREPLPDARMFQVGSPAAMPYVGMRESLKTIISIPAETREAVALENADYLRTRLGEIGVESYDFGTKHNSPIISCAPSDVEELNKRLRDKRIFCSPRKGRLRVSPHFYNTHKEVDTLIENLR